MKEEIKKEEMKKLDDRMTYLEWFSVIVGILFIILTVIMISIIVT